MNSKEIKANLSQRLKELHLPTVRECYAQQAQTARQESYSYERYLLELAEAECEVRRQNRISRYLKESKLPLEKTLDSFDQKRLPRKVTVQLNTLVEGAYLDRCENVLAFGNPGSGKTHLLCALGQELIHQGYRVLYLPCSLLVQNLLIAKRDLNLPRLLKRLAKYSALIIDDIGYVQQSREEMEVLFTLFADRYERGSVMITSNLPFSKWEKIFKDPMTTAAAIDRLVHHSIILELNLPSYRLEQSKMKNIKQKKG
jgi:DNA replication protein DnaC